MVSTRESAGAVAKWDPQKGRSDWRQSTSSPMPTVLSSWNTSRSVFRSLVNGEFCDFDGTQGWEMRALFLQYCNELV